MPMRSVQDTTIGFETMAMVWIHPALSETFFVTDCEQIAGDAKSLNMWNVKIRFFLSAPCF